MIVFTWSFWILVFWYNYCRRIPELYSLKGLLKWYLNKEWRVKSKSRRFSGRIPAETWKAGISSNGISWSNAKIANIGRDGAYLITEDKFKIDSFVTVCVVTPHISFSLDALVVRNGMNGLGVRFVNNNKSIKSILLHYMCRYLS